MSKQYLSVCGHIHMYIHKLHMYKDVQGYRFTYVNASDVAFISAWNFYLLFS